MLCKYPQYDERVGGIRPCGKCRHCRLNQRAKKTTRLTLEGKDHEHCLFVTLTYSNEFLPVQLYDTKTGECIAGHPLGCLDKRAVQLFLKRLRKKMSPTPLRIFYAGEYGDEKQRPHYHLVLWGLPYDQRDYIFNSWTDPHTKTLMCDPDYLTVEIPKSNWDVAQYCNKYVVKSMTKTDDPRLEGRPPEFCEGSLGIGLPFVKNIVDALKTDSAEFYFKTYHDIPRTIKMDGKILVLDRYLRQKVLEGLGKEISDISNETGKKLYSQKMLALQARAERVASDSSPSQSSLAYLMESTMFKDNEQKILTAERKGDLYNSKTGDF